MFVLTVAGSLHLSACVSVIQWVDIFWQWQKSSDWATNWWQSDLDTHPLSCLLQNTKSTNRSDICTSALRTICDRKSPALRGSSSWIQRWQSVKINCGSGLKNMPRLVHSCRQKFTAVLLVILSEDIITPQKVLLVLCAKCGTWGLFFLFQNWIFFLKNMGKYNEVLETKLYTCIGTPQIV